MQNISKTILYWICQILGWGFYVFVLIYSSLNHVKNEGEIPKVIALQVIIGTTSLTASHLIRYFIKKYRWLDLTFKKLFPRMTIAAVIGSISSIIMIHLIMIMILDWENTVAPIVWSNVPFYTTNLFFLLMVWSVLYVSYQSIESARISRIEKLEAEAALKDAELIALKGQINPHFLFNSLNNIRALILENQEKAREMVTNLSDLLRYSIEFNKQERVTVSEEIEIVKNYLQLESIQYDGRLKYDIKVDAPSKDFILPPMVIQTLAENAIKHGISQVKEGGQIEIHVKHSNSSLAIIVSNTGRLSNKNKGTGVGINNVIERIKILFDVEPEFGLEQKDHKVVASLKLPAKS